MTFWYGLGIVDFLVLEAGSSRYQGMTCDLSVCHVDDDDDDDDFC